jgi:nitrate/nitrite transporter NarK
LRELPTAAAGLAQINALGNLSGFVFNYLIGWIQAETGSFPLAMMPIAATATVGTICVLTIGRRQPRTVSAVPWRAKTESPSKCLSVSRDSLFAQRSSLSPYP